MDNTTPTVKLSPAMKAVVKSMRKGFRMKITYNSWKCVLFFKQDKKFKCVRKIPERTFAALIDRNIIEFVKNDEYGLTQLGKKIQL